MPTLQFVFLGGTRYRQARETYEAACRIADIEPDGITYVNRSLQEQPVVPGSYCRLSLPPLDETSVSSLLEQLRQLPRVDPMTVELLPDETQA